LEEIVTRQGEMMARQGEMIAELKEEVEVEYSKFADEFSIQVRLSNHNLS
jgi:hypothetical protein